MQQKEEYKYFAFISYNSKDARWGKRLQRKLEGYRMPATICSEHGWKRRPIVPVFYAPTDIQPGDLRQELEARLRASRHLIVICSPHSAKAKWVGWEIAYFHSLGRTENIHFFIVDGEPHSQDPERECFNPIIEELGIPEQLGANIHERVSRWPWVNRERAYVQLVTKLLGVEFDSLWQRHRRLLRRRCTLGVIAVVAVFAALIGVWRANQPVDVSVRLQEVSIHNDHLPPLQKAMVSITLENETKRDTLDGINDKAHFANIPHSAVGQPIRITMVCGNWLTVDTTMTLAEELVLSIRRDPSLYGNVIFTLWDAEAGAGKAGVGVTIAGVKVVSDVDGRVRLTVPLERQDTTYVVHSTAPLRDSLLRMPVTESSVMVVR
ncbi:MAG: toll/interleukin-1 receptor domain-containing protein [Bacteroidales bacterium]|nr:toll/interleukin-1 receptor domain-containing protein [Bacteroidales bacterium]